jgi:uncharacterized protein (TIGR03437 family)
MITTFAGGGQDSVDGVRRAAHIRLNVPTGLAGGAGNLYIAERDQNRVLKVAPDTAVSLFAGNGQVNCSGETGLAINAPLHWPTGVAVDTSGNVYIANTLHHQIRKVTENPNISTLAGNRFCDSGVPPDSGPAAQANLNGPTSVDVDSEGNIYIADSGNNKVHKVAGGTLTRVAGSTLAGGFAGDGGAAIFASLNSPQQVTFDAGGNMYIADSQNHRIRRVNNSGVISTFAGSGQAGFSGDGGPATQAALNGPSGLAVDVFGNVYISDTFSSRIRRVTPDGIISTYAGGAEHGFRGDDGVATGAFLDRPQRIAMDHQRTALYIADTGNNRVRRVCTPPLVPFFTEPSPGASIRFGGFPTLVEVRVRDDCGNPLKSGSVVATFSNGDPPVQLQSLGDDEGRWHGTWLPTNAQSPVVTIAATAQATGLTSGEAQLTVGAGSSTTPPAISFDGTVNAASFDSEPALAPGSLISIFGQNLASRTLSASSLPLPTSLAGTTVEIRDDRQAPFGNSHPARLLFVSETQINAMIPYEVPANRHYQIIVRRSGNSASEVIPVAAAAPGVFKDPRSITQGIITHADFTLADTTRPASRGEIVVIFCTGLGLVSPAVASGAAAPSSPLSRTVLPVEVTIAGRTAQVTFAGLTPGFAGLYQVNAVVPNEAPSGNPHVIVYVNRGASTEQESQAGVTMTIR